MPTEELLLSLVTKSKRKLVKNKRKKPTSCSLSIFCVADLCNVRGFVWPFFRSFCNEIDDGLRIVTLLLDLLTS